MSDLLAYPGGDIVDRGIKDIRAGYLSEDALLVLIARPKLNILGLEVPKFPGSPSSPEHALYERIEMRMPQGAFGLYNSLVSRIVSFANTYASVSR